MDKNIDKENLKKENLELYKVAFDKGTEAPFAGKYVNEKDDGMYHCAVCGNALFSSDTKFDSGSGWPSFTDPANKEAVDLVDDNSHGMRRTEVLCKKCGAHLGHVFPDGPIKADGGMCDRFCINSISLDLKSN
jgi:peptide-methionine (R)-S-oxide reductase